MTRLHFSTIMAGTLTAVLIFSKTSGAADALVPLPLKLPTAFAHVTPENFELTANQEPPPDPAKSKPRPPFLAPKGVTNLASGKKVTTSAPRLYTGTLQQITDGKKEAREEDVVEMPKGVQWIQVDLEKNCSIYAIVLWHDHRDLLAFHSVVVQVADDADFKKNVRTLFNNDFANKANLGIGTNKEYFETAEGRLIDTKGTNARYVRCYSNGNNKSSWNVYQELEVYGLAAE